MVGVQVMSKMWQSNKRLVRSGKNSIEFVYKGFSDHPAKTKDDQKYDGTQFVHGIRVACGGGEEKQPHYFFGLKKQPGGEIFSLGKEDIELFKKAKGDILDREIKHLKTEVLQVT
jgi:hypothetical protein